MFLFVLICTSDYGYKYNALAPLGYRIFNTTHPVI